ncbi:hypothetical protein B0J11DRAFT_447619 [Dendryphion nanum]|uniref:Uncharacterized protein n=1 Tax=Dendryphion nanum TaxID=256645 RepID=A0A9P9I9B1_9PLEO|nr:hypothetical protein B0J11DRAFT_447619 [Dendryphion nanum]
MALEGAETSVLDDGFFLMTDQVIGRRVSGFSKKDHPFQTEEGLDICRMSCFEDKATYRSNPSTVFAFLTNPSTESNIPSGYTNQGKDKVKILLVQLFEMESTVIFYKRSHLYPLKTKDAGIGLFDVNLENMLGRKDIKPFEVKMEGGGFAIIDGRLAFKLIQGRSIIAGFASEGELRSWVKMKFPKTESVMQKIDEMVSETLGINYEFTS